MAVIPMLAYENGAAAIDWLVEAFGFEERADEDGTIGHAELVIGGETIMLATPTPDYVSPKRMRRPDVGVRHYRVEDPEGQRWMFSQDLPS